VGRSRNVDGSRAVIVASMQCAIISIGKWKSGPEKALFEHYAGRLHWKLTLKEHDIKKPLAPEALKAKEADLLLASCKGIDTLWALDEAGKEYSSIAFAKHIARIRDQGSRSMAFLIGGADGLHDTVRSRAQMLFSLGRVTWPHLLVRGLLAEQLYRAQTILSGHPYHRE
jgi:23S rRNA (pseudouridine1915-N3)-methyltransferase